MLVTINGQQQALPVGSSVSGMLQFLELLEQPLLVEHNGIALLKSEWTTAVLQENDRVELVRIVAGG